MNARLLVGKSGIGKTYFVKQFAIEHKLSLIDCEDYDLISRISTDQVRDATGKRIMYLFEDVDLLSKEESKNLSTFLKQAVEGDIDIFLTAQNIKKVHTDITRYSTIEMFPVKNVAQVDDILEEMYGEEHTLVYLADCSDRSNGDIRKAIQNLLYPKSTCSPNEEHQVDIVRSVLFEKNRALVHNLIQNTPINTIYYSLAETIGNFGSADAIEVIRFIEKKMYKAPEEFLKTILVYSLPPFTQNVGILTPRSMKLPDVEQSIVEKVQASRRCSSQKARQMIYFAKDINIVSFFENVGLDKREMSYMGYSLKAEKSVVKKEVPVVSELTAW